MRWRWLVAGMLLSASARADESERRWLLSANLLVFADDVPTPNGGGPQTANYGAGVSMAYVDPLYRVGARFELGRTRGFDAGERDSYKGSGTQTGAALVVSPWRFDHRAGATTAVLIEAGLWYRSFPIRIQCGIPSGGRPVDHCAFDSHAWTTRLSTVVQHTLRVGLTAAVVGGLAYTWTTWQEVSGIYECRECELRSHTFIGELRVGYAW